MNPSYPDPTPSGIDYLNQIAPPAPPAGVDKKTKLIIFFMIIPLFSHLIWFVFLK